VNRRILGIVLALVLALAGTFMLVRYVESARDDAAAPEPTTTVLIIGEAVAQGASLAEIERNVTPVEVPEDLAAPGALSSFDGVSDDLVAGVALEPGEQMLRSRLVEPEVLLGVEVPAGLQKVTVSLAPERAVGGRLKPGDSVGITISFDPFEVAAAGVQSDPATTDAAQAPTRTPNTTHLTLSQILVTGVQLSRNDAERTTETQSPDDDGDQPEIAADIAEAPDNELLVTFAVSAAEAEQIIFAAEFGRIWLTGQNPDTDDSGSRILTLEGAYVGVPR
jgi:pilus assembly protein CpaB